VFELGTTVVNVRAAFYDIYIGRGRDPKTGQVGKWGNPYSHLDGTLAKFKVDTREEAIERYAEYIQTRPDLLLALRELKGKILGCWCAPKACHGQVLANLANALEDQ